MLKTSISNISRIVEKEKNHISNIPRIWEHIKHEIYNYSERNLNKLYKEILKMNYDYEYFNNSNFEDINIPRRFYSEFKLDWFTGFGCGELLGCWEFTGWFFNDSICFFNLDISSDCWFVWTSYGL